MFSYFALTLLWMSVCVLYMCVFMFFWVIFEHLCVFLWFCVCVCVGEEVKVGDIPKPSLPSILPKKPLPPKTSSSPSSLPPRRPEKPPTLASVHTHTHTCSYEEKPPHISERIKPNVVVWFTCSGVKAPSLRAGLRHQILPLTGHMTLVSLTDRSFNQWDHDMVAQRLSERSLSLSVYTRGTCWSSPVFVFVVGADVDLDVVVSSTEKLSHPTASRPRVTDRRPRSQIITPVSLLLYSACHEGILPRILRPTSILHANSCRF